MKIFRVYIGLCVILLMTACSPIYYMPNTQNVPLLSEKDEANITLIGNGNQIEAHGSYAAGQNVGLVLNAGLFIPPDDDNGDGGRGRFVEVGAGYFKPLRPNLIIETYGLLGLGGVENYFPSRVSGGSTSPDDGRITAQMLRIGLQPNIGYKSKYFSAAFSMRWCWLSFSNIEGNLIFDGVQQQEYLKEHKSNFLFEPALTIRGGWERIQGQVQLGVSANLSEKYFNQEDSWMTLGIHFKFN